MTVSWQSRISLFSFLLLLGFPGTGSASELPLPPPLPQIATPNPAQAELGRMLFFDRRLSGDGTMSCAVCHIPQEAFADGQPLSGAYPTSKHWRHTPSLLNVGYLDVLFWDGRSDTLEQQSLEPMHTAFEMNLDPDYLVARLAEEPAYRETFQRVYAGPPTGARIAAALSAFERTLTVTDSSFDRFLAGDGEALAPAAKRGADIFFGERGGCARCHAGALLSDRQFHNTGIGETEELLNDPQRRATRNYFLRRLGVEKTDRDPGRFAVTKDPADLGAFRTPPLRQVAQTAPYMHNGSLATLEEVVDFYDRGGGADANRSPLLLPLHLSAAEKEELLAFLRSLSGTLPAANPPVATGGMRYNGHPRQPQIQEPAVTFIENRIERLQKLKRQRPQYQEIFVFYETLFRFLRGEQGSFLSAVPETSDLELETPGGISPPQRCGRQSGRRIAFADFLVRLAGVLKENGQQAKDDLARFQASGFRGQTRSYSTSAAPASTATGRFSKRGPSGRRFPPPCSNISSTPPFPSPCRKPGKKGWRRGPKGGSKATVPSAVDCRRWQS